jgi:hypothetical protein
MFKRYYFRILQHDKSGKTIKNYLLKRFLIMHIILKINIRIGFHNVPVSLIHASGGIALCILCAKA